MVASFSLCIVCDTIVSCHFFAVFVKMKDSRCAEVFVSASPNLTRRIRTLVVLGSFGQKMSAIFWDYLASGNVTKCEYNNRFYVRCVLTGKPLKDKKFPLLYKKSVIKKIPCSLKSLIKQLLLPTLMLLLNQTGVLRYSSNYIG